MDSYTISKELKKYWQQLTVDQQKVVLNVVNSFTQNSQQVQEAEVMYRTSADKSQGENFSSLNDVQKESVLSLIKTIVESDVQYPGFVTAEQYDQEIEEAMQRMDDGVYISHEEVLRELEQW